MCYLEICNVSGKSYFKEVGLLTDTIRTGVPSREEAENGIRQEPTAASRTLGMVYFISWVLDFKAFLVSMATYK